MTVQTIQNPPFDWRDTGRPTDAAIQNRPGRLARLVISALASLRPLRPERPARTFRPGVQVPDHLRRDVGLPPIADSPRHWDYF